MRKFCLFNGKRVSPNTIGCCLDTVIDIKSLNAIHVLILVQNDLKIPKGQVQTNATNIINSYSLPIRRICMHSPAGHHL